MITNTYIKLDKDSEIRTDAINTIKYTLLLDYKIPEYDDDYILSNVFQACHQCCYRLFLDDHAKNLIQEHGYHFFGTNHKLGTYHRSFFDIGVMPSFFPEKISFFEPYMHNMLLQHCIMSSYHAIKTELSCDKTITAYKIQNDRRETTNTDNKVKSSQASDFEKKMQTHLIAMPYIENLAYKDQFSELLFSICDTTVSLFKNTWNSDKSPRTWLANIKKLHDALMPIYSIEQKRFHAETIPALYQSYLVERIFNIHMFHSTLKAILFINDQTSYRLDQEDLIPSLASITSLPNVFSRQTFLAYAILHIDKDTSSTNDFWKEHDLSKDDSDMFSSARRITRIFDLYHWKRQLELFTNYLSQYIIPVYEWCFIGMLFDSLEKKYDNTDHISHLLKAKQLLESFMVEHCNDLLYPFSPEQSCPITANMLNIINIPDDIYNLDTISPDILKLLVKEFSPDSRSFDLNLATHLKPDYFKDNPKNLPNSSNTRIRKFYIDLLRYNYWQ